MSHSHGRPKAPAAETVRPTTSWVWPGSCRILIGSFLLIGLILLGLSDWVDLVMLGFSNWIDFAGLIC
jgi:hypothetical protein